MAKHRSKWLRPDPDPVPLEPHVFVVVYEDGEIHPHAVAFSMLDEAERYRATLGEEATIIVAIVDKHIVKEAV